MLGVEQVSVTAVPVSTVAVEPTLEISAEPGTSVWGRKGGRRSQMCESLIY